MENTSMPVVLATLVVFLVGCSTTGKETQSASTPSQEPTDAVIERYIRAHPEVIEQSLQGLLAKREAELKERHKAALATKQNELLHDPASPVSGNPKGEITLV
ncbi:MAG TPA: hypothetical protein VN039_01555, partial [Nitrospira sp.]|nr:hypothetical protein [Nitrospira sp.]